MKNCDPFGMECSFLFFIITFIYYLLFAYYLLLLITYISISVSITKMNISDSFTSKEIIENRFPSFLSGTIPCFLKRGVVNVTYWWDSLVRNDLTFKKITLTNDFIFLFKFSLLKINYFLNTLKLCENRKSW